MDRWTAAVALGGFVGGILSKVAADWFKDWRQQRQQRAAAANAFARVEAAMPVLLLEEMRRDVASNSAVRNFAVLRMRGNVYGLHGGHFEYNAEDHEDLAGKVAMLENLGFVIDKRVRQDSPFYRMTEPFWEFLAKSNR